MPSIVMVVEWRSIGLPKLIKNGITAAKTAPIAAHALAVNVWKWKMINEPGGRRQMRDIRQERNNRNCTSGRHEKRP
jgi:hypothetical protein